MQNILGRQIVSWQLGSQRVHPPEREHSHSEKSERFANVVVDQRYAAAVVGSELSSRVEAQPIICPVAPIAISFYSLRRARPHLEGLLVRGHADAL